MSFDALTLTGMVLPVMVAALLFHICNRAGCAAMTVSGTRMRARGNSPGAGGPDRAPFGFKARRQI